MALVPGSQTSDPQSRQAGGILFSVGLALQPGLEPLEVPYLNILQIPQYRDVTCQLGRLPQQRMHQNPALHIHLGSLAVIIGPVQKLPDCNIHRPPRPELLLYFQPLLPGIHASTFTIQARDIEFNPIVLAYIMTVSGPNLDPSLIVLPGCIVTPEHTFPRRRLLPARPGRSHAPAIVRTFRQLSFQN